MDIDEELNAILGPRNSDLSSLSSNIALIKTANPHELRREHEHVNKSILTSSMREWTETVDVLSHGDVPKEKRVEVVSQGDRAKKGVRFPETSGSFGSDIMRLLRSDAVPVDETISRDDSVANQAARLRMERANRLRHEQLIARGRINRKIKSKNFHRHALRRSVYECLRKEEGQGGHGAGLADKIEQLEKMRAEERISLKHRSGGKFARMQKLRAKYDSMARENLNEMRRKGDELTRRAGDGGDEDEDEEEEEIEDIGGEEGGQDSGSDSDESEGDHETVAIPGGRTLMENSSSHKVKCFSEGNREPRATEKGTVSSVLCVDQSADWETGAPDAEERFKQAVLEVYSKDNELAAEFEREKKELAQAEAPKDVDMCLLGWGSFTGPGLEAADKRRKRRARVKAPKVVRQDEAKPRVWIKETLPEGLHKHLIKSIPYPYNTAEQFNLSRKELVSSSFNLQTVHRKLVKPRFTNKAGHFIYPTKNEEKITNE